MRISAVLVVVLAALVAAGCGSSRGFSPIEQGLSQGLELKVSVLPRSAPVASHDGFEVIVDFQVEATGPMPYRHLVQEIEQTMTQVGGDGRVHRESVVLVEAFRLSFDGESGGRLRFGLEPFQRDRHYDSGYASGIEKLREITVERRVRVYPALVEGADWTFYGFAHVPENRDGSLMTNIPPNFNRSHQERFQMRGRVVADAREASREYVLRYEWRGGGPGTKGEAVASLTLAPSAEEGNATVWWSHGRSGEGEGAGK